MAARMRDTVCFYAVLIAFGLMCLAWSLPAAAFYWIIAPTRRPRVGQFAIMTGFRIHLWILRACRLAEFDLHALDRLVGAPPLVIACNHRSLLDAVLVVSRLPRVVCITKASLWNNGFLGGGIRMAAYIRNDSPLKLVRAAADALRAGQHLLIFPEGTRSATGQLAPFKAGFVLMARSAGVPVQTVILESNSPYLQKGWSLFRRPAFPLRYSARLGERFDMGCDNPGLDGSGLDGLGRDSLGRDSLGRDSLGRDSLGRDSLGRDSGTGAADIERYFRRELAENV